MSEGYVRKRRLGEGRISKQKLEEPFKRADLLNMPYVEHAKSIARRIMNGEYVSQDEIIDVRLDAVNDRNNLKGDFVISVFLELMEQGVKFDRWEKGKAVKISDQMARKIFENEITRELNVTAFCQENRLTRNKYYRIANCDVKDADKRAELEKIKAEVKETTV